MNQIQVNSVKNGTQVKQIVNSYSKDTTFTFLRQVSVKPSTKTIFLVPSTFSVTNHDNFVHHFREIMDDSSFNVDASS